jgi:multidrug efflux pump subunit AcrB
LIKHFFDCGWIKALIIDIVAVIIQIIIAFILGLLFGVTIMALGI